MPRLLSICLLLCCLACHRPSRTITRGFYSWKQRYQPDSTELHALHALGVQQLYVRMFDVALDAGKSRAVPIARLDQRSAFWIRGILTTDSFLSVKDSKYILY